MVVFFAESEKNECFEEVYLMKNISKTLKFYQNNFPSNGNMLVKKTHLKYKNLKKNFKNKVVLLMALKEILFNTI